MRITKAKAQEILRTVEGDERFFNADGTVSANVRELAGHLAQMPQGAFNHHCSSQRCDFAAWVQDILQDTTLAKNLRAAKGVRAKVEKAVSDRVAQLEKYA